MKVSELIEQLEKMPGDTEVCVAPDHRDGDRSFEVENVEHNLVWDGVIIPSERMEDPEEAAHCKKNANEEVVTIWYHTP